jgi:hypothetical protein
MGGELKVEAAKASDQAGPQSKGFGPASPGRDYLLKLPASGSSFGQSCPGTQMVRNDRCRLNR